MDAYEVEYTNETGDYRTYTPYTVTEEDGAVVEMTLHEERVEGRWEPFYTARRIA